MSGKNSRAIGPDRKRIEEIYRLLSQAYPDIKSSLLENKSGNPLDVLVATILSQATNDKLSSRAFDALKRAMPDWEQVVNADPRLIEEQLSVGGLQREKTKKIQTTLAKIKDDFGSLSLDVLKKLTPREAYDYLLTLPGVGPKTAACVLVFGLGIPAFPVDTHVHRICRRLSLVPQSANAVKTQAILEDAVPDEIKKPLHVMMINHGRKVCLPRKAKCDLCPLRSFCR